MAKTQTEDTAVATNDAYTGMLAISLLALILGCVFLYLDWSQYPDKPPPRAAIPQRSAPVQQPVDPGQKGQPPVVNPMNPGVPMPMVPPAPMPNPNAPPEPKQ